MIKTTLLLLLLAVQCAGALAATRTLTQHIQIEGDVSLELINRNGDIEITGWDRDYIMLKANVKTKTTATLRKTGFTIEGEGSGHLTVRAKHAELSGDATKDDRASVRFEVRLPEHMDLRRISTINGDISVREMRGVVHLNSVNGDLRANDLLRGVSMETVNGGIAAQFDALSDEVQIRSLNGGITLSIDREESFLIRADTVRGQIKTRFEVIPESDPSWRFLHGQVGKGGPTLVVRGVNGSINLDRD